DHADACLSGSDKWRNAYRNASRQAQAKGQGFRRSGRSEVQGKHHQGDWQLATDGGRSEAFPLCDRRAAPDGLWRAVPDRAREIKMTASRPRHCWSMDAVMTRSRSEPCEIS